MSLLAPLFFAAAAAIAAGVIALHFLARSQPPRAFFPTARFVPESRERAPSRSITPNDLALLALRVLAVMLLGLAFARPTRTAARRALVRVVVLDRSRAVASPAAAADSARRWLRDGDHLVVFDSTARREEWSVLDSVPRGDAAATRGSLSAALVRAMRVATTVRDAADSIEIVIVSPLVREEWDHATVSVRAVWPGGLRLVQVDAAPERAVPRVIALRGAPADPLRATLALMGAGTGTGRRGAADGARVVRDSRLTPADSAWARGGGVLVHWPAEPDRAAMGDTVGAVVAEGVVLVAPFERRATLVGGAAIARWVDGVPAATERPLGVGCVRDVAVPLDRPGDLALRVALRRLVTAISAACAGTRDLAPLGPTQMATLAGTAHPLATAALAPAPDAGRAAMPWLIVAAVLCLVGEQFVRRRRGDR